MFLEFIYKSRYTFSKTSILPPPAIAHWAAAGPPPKVRSSPRASNSAPFRLFLTICQPLLPFLWPSDRPAGTSSRSSKLIHGGLRYLEQLDFGLVLEAKREQKLMLNRLCPHLVEPVPFLYPLKHLGWERAYVGAGILIYDFLTY